MAIPNFALLLRQYRMDAGYSQEALAEKARISVESVGALERGTRRWPYRETVRLLAAALELDDTKRALLEAASKRSSQQPSRLAVPPRRAPSPLPNPMTPFIGRATDLDTIAALLAANRLVTITGSGGIGKTRAAIEVASRLQQAEGGEIAFVDLSNIEDEAAVIGVFVVALQLPAGDNSVSTDVLIASLRERRILIVIDNCEHVLPVLASIVASITRSCSNVTLLATSRERLAVRGETVYRLPSLEMPSDVPRTLASARQFAAIDLFFSRVQSTDIHFVLPDGGIEMIVSICRKLDGIPLAIEIAAGRVFAFGLRGVRERLRDGLDLTARSRDLPARQQTLLATISWSYRLLTDAERLLLDRLSVFAGGFCLEAVEAVCADERLGLRFVADCVSSLVDKSLIHVVRPDSELRYALLDSVRSFAARRLAECGEIDRWKRRHAEWVATFAESVDLRRNQMSDHALMELADPEFFNIRSAIEWSLASAEPEVVALAGRIVSGIFFLSIVFRYRYREGRAWAEAAIERIDPERHAPIAARLLPALIQLSTGLTAVAWGRRAIPVFERVGDVSAIALLHSTLAMRYQRFEMWDEAAAEMELGEAIAATTQLGGRRQVVYVHNRAFVRLQQGRIDNALADIALATALARRLGDEGLMWTLYRADAEFARGNVQAAADLVEPILSRALEKGSSHDREIVNAASRLARIRAYQHDLDGAHEAASEALACCSGTVRVVEYESLIEIVALIEAQRGNMPVAARLAAFVEAWRRKNGTWRPPGPPGDSETQQLLRILERSVPATELAALMAHGAVMSPEDAFAEATGAGNEHDAH